MCDIFILYLSLSLSFIALRSFFCVCVLCISLHACVTVCGCDTVIVDKMITGLRVLLSPQRKHICSKSNSLHKHTPAFL